MARFNIEQEIEVPFINENGEQDYDCVSVKFVVDASYGNLGIGSYEFWGMRGYDEQMGWDIDDVKWDETLYSPEVNAIIDKYLGEHMDSILDKMDKYENF